MIFHWFFLNKPYKQKNKNHLYMSIIHAIKLSIEHITKNKFVVVQETDNCFEIGLVRETEIQNNHKESKILILTAGDFPTKIPTFRKI